MRFVTLIAVAISVFACASQSASALSVQDSYRRSSELLKRKPDSLAGADNPDKAVAGILGKLGAGHGAGYGAVRDAVFNDIAQLIFRAISKTR
jgi:hypothetical protein